MPEIHLKQTRFTSSAFGLFTKNKKRIQKSEEAEGLKYIYQDKLDNICFQHDMAYGDFKDSPRRTASDISLRDKAFNIVRNPKYDEYQCGDLLQWFRNFLIKSLTINTKEHELILV